MRTTRPRITGVICSACASSTAFDHLLEPPELVALDVDEEHRGGAVRQAQLELGGEIALEQGDHGQHRQPGAERHDHPGRAGARAVQVGERDAHPGAAPLRRSADAAQHDEGEADEQGGRAGGHGDEDQREPPVRDAEHRERAESDEAEAEPDQDGGPRQPLRRHHERTEHRRRRHLARPGERPDGEDERGQQPAGRRDQKRQRVDVERSTRIGSSGPKAAASSHGTNCPIVSPTRTPMPASASTWSR